MHTTARGLLYHSSRVLEATMEENLTVIIATFLGFEEGLATKSLVSLGDERNKVNLLKSRELL